MGWQKNYAEIAKVLNLDMKADFEAAGLLDSMLKAVDYASVENLLKGKNVLIFGAGPSLKNDVLKIKALKLQKSMTVISADGSTRALME